MDSLVTQVLASLVVAILSWSGGQMLNRMKSKGPATVAAGVPAMQVVPGAMPYPPPAAPRVNFGQVLIHVAILQFAVNIIGFVIGFTVGFVGASSGASADTITTAAVGLILILGTLAAIVFFLIFGLRVPKAVRWQHLTYVTLITIPLTLLVNAIALQSFPTVASVVFTGIQAFFAMGVGGALANLFAPKDRAPVPVGVPAGQQYTAGPGAPYGAAGWPSVPLYPGPPYPAPPYAAPGLPAYPVPGAPQYPAPPGAPGTAPAYPPYGPPAPYGPYGPQYPPAQGGQVPGSYQPGWPQQPPAGQVSSPYPGPQQPPTNPPQGDQGQR
jgi:hypothetical protein